MQTKISLSKAETLAFYGAQAAIAKAAETPGLRYAELFSETLGAEVRIGYEVEEAADYQFGRIAEGVEIVEVWHGGWDCGSSLNDAVLKSLATEFEVARVGGRA